jgi:hypothetical protein
MTGFVAMAKAKLTGDLGRILPRSALAGSVASVLRLIAKALLTENIRRILQVSERGEQTVLGKLSAEDGEGLGWRLIVRYFREQHIDGMGEYTVKQQLANLKASGGRPQSPIGPRAPWCPPPAPTYPPCKPLTDQTKSGLPCLLSGPASRAL